MGPLTQKHSGTYWKRGAILMNYTLRFRDFIPRYISPNKSLILLQCREHRELLPNSPR